jgi:hypothetical protein
MARQSSSSSAGVLPRPRADRVGGAVISLRPGQEPRQDRVDAVLWPDCRLGRPDRRFRAGRRLSCPGARSPAGQPARRRGQPHRLRRHDPGRPSGRVPARTRRGSHLGPAVLKVVRHGLADIGGQREPAGAASLAPHRDLAAVPVEVIECERGRLPARRDASRRVRMARSRRPTAVSRSQLPSSAATASSPGPRGRPTHAKPAGAGTAAASSRDVQPARNKNRSSDRSPVTRTLAAATRRRPHCWTTKLVTWPAVRCSRSSPPGRASRCHKSNRAVPR